MPKKSDESRCWPGYEPVKGKKPHEQGSCRPKSETKMDSGEKKFRKKRRSQLDRWEDKHPGKRKSAAQHLGAPKKAAKKKAAKKKSAPAKKRAVKKKP